MSTTLQRYPFALAANGVMILQCSGTQFFVTSATGALDLKLDGGNRFQGLLSGQGYKGQPFGQITITDLSGAANTGYLIVSDDDYIDRRIVGAVTFAPLNASFVNSQKTVTNASAQLLAANPERKYLLIQNNDATGLLYVRLDGGVATAATGLKIAAGGGSYELSTVVPGEIITAIGSIASNANVVVVEG